MSQREQSRSENSCREFCLVKNEEVSRIILFHRIDANLDNLDVETFD